MSYRRRRAREQVAAALSELAVERADVGYRVYKGPQGKSGLHDVTPAGSVSQRVVAGSGHRTYRPGTVVPVAHRQGSAQETIIAEPPPGKIGTGAVPAERRVEAMDSVGVTAMVPDELPAGAATAVVLTGFGFREAPVDTFRAAEADGAGDVVADPLVSVGAVVWSSATTVSATITVSAAAPVGHPIHIEVTRT